MLSALLPSALLISSPSVESVHSTNASGSAGAGAATASDVAAGVSVSMGVMAFRGSVNTMASTTAVTTKAAADTIAAIFPLESFLSGFGCCPAYGLPLAGRYADCGDTGIVIVSAILLGAGNGATGWFPLNFLYTAFCAGSEATLISAYLKSAAL